MAIDLTSRARGAMNPNRHFYYVQNEIDWAVAATTKTSALAAADVLEVIDVPAGTCIINAGIETMVAPTGASSDTALDLGVTGIDADAWADGYDADAAVAGTYSQNPAAYQPIVIGSTADTIDVLIQASTTPPTAGKIRVWAILINSGTSHILISILVDRAHSFNILPLLL